MMMRTQDISHPFIYRVGDGGYHKTKTCVHTGNQQPQMGHSIKKMMYKSHTRVYLNPKMRHPSKHVS